MPGKSNDYNHLLPMGSDDEDEDDPLVLEVSQAPEVKITDSSKSLKNGNGYHFKTSQSNSERCCSPTTMAVILAMSLLCLGIGYLAGFLTPVSFDQLTKSSGKHTVGKRTPNWRTKISDYGTESCVRLVDVDGDGILDLIIGIALGKDVSQMVTEDSMGEFCKNIGMGVPCAGGVIALRGYDGKLLWKVDSYSEVFALNCHTIDVNKDGVKDCIATGRLATMQAINPLNGEILWDANSKYVNRGWNIYSPLIIQDLDFDGVGEIMIAHGGDPTIPAEIHERKACWLMMISGGTGVPVGRSVMIPEKKEIYISPVLHERKDGSQYILYGSGGETVGGLFLAISIPDLYRYVKNLPHDHVVPNVKGNYFQWGSIQPSAIGEIEIFRSDEKGVMVPPVLVDVNKDGVNDILMSCFDGALILYDGETLDIMWKTKFEDAESYSSAAPGYFNDDDVLDFMAHWSKGAWPFYNNTYTVILDGKDGTVLWNLTTNKYDVTSDLVARTSEKHRDIFIFKAQGRHGQDLSGTGAFHGATGVQRVVNRRSVDGKEELTETFVTEDNEDLEGVILPKSHFRSKRRVIDKDYIECESDQTVFLTEMFALDRTTMKAPLKLWEKGSEKYYYKLDAHDRKLVEEVVKTYGSNHTMTENEVPWSRGKRQANKPYCILIQPDERTTGAIGDVDGDGKLDVIVNIVSVGVLRDEYAHFVKMKFDTDIYKVNLEDAIAHELYVPINVSLHHSMQYVMNENKMTSLKFLPTNKQTWGGYMGSFGDSIFTP